MVGTACPGGYSCLDKKACNVQWYPCTWRRVTWSCPTNGLRTQLTEKSSTATAPINHPPIAVFTSIVLNSASHANSRHSPQGRGGRRLKTSVPPPLSAPHPQNILLSNYFETGPDDVARLNAYVTYPASCGPSRHSQMWCTYVHVCHILLQTQA